MDIEDLKRILEENKGRFKRCIVISDGVFSMLGEFQDIKRMQEICDEYDEYFEEGIISVVDDSHGMAGLGKTGRGCEEESGGKCDLLIGTLGKGFGTDGGYVTGDKVFMDYFRESAATYIYSNPISPSTAGAALAAVELIDTEEGRQLLETLSRNIRYFKGKMKERGFEFAADSDHPIQPVLIGDPKKTKKLTDMLFESGILVTNISYPIVPLGRDEIRVQISAVHTKEDLDDFIEKFTKAGKKLKLIR